VENLKQFFEKNKLEYCQNFDVSLISSIKLGGTIKYALFPRNKKELVLILKFFYLNKIYYKICGNASNVLFVEKISYPVIFTNKMSDEIEIKGRVVDVSAGMMIPKFCEHLKKNQLSGFEGLVGIPATVGGAIMCNAGAFGYSISDRLVKISVFSNGKVFDLKRNEIHFSHHFSNLLGFVVLSATFLFENKNEYDIISLCNEFNYKRGLSQPSGLSLGSVFKKVNGKSAGFYIERAGLKDMRIGGIVVSSKHANFFINDKGGSILDFLRLLVNTQTQVEKQFGISLVPEIEKIGDIDETFSRFTHSFKK
jgi:UDP-N-acetylmuramate dehydrogenase